MYNYFLLLASPEAADGASSSSPYSLLITFGLIFLIMYVLVIRPSSRDKKKRATMLSALKAGDHCITAGGIHGVVVNVKDKTAILRVDESTTIEFNKESIARVAPSGDVSGAQTSAKNSKSATRKKSKAPQQIKETSDTSLNDDTSNDTSNDATTTPEVSSSGERASASKTNQTNNRKNTKASIRPRTRKSNS